VGDKNFQAWGEACRPDGAVRRRPRHAPHSLPCLQTYGIEVLTAIEEADGVEGFVLKGRQDRVVVAVRRCTAFTLGRRMQIEDEKVLAVEMPKKRDKDRERERPIVDEEIFGE